MNEQVTMALIGGAVALAVAWLSSWAQHGGRRRRRRREITEEIEMLGLLDPWDDKRQRAHDHIDALLDRHLPARGDDDNDKLKRATWRGALITMSGVVLVVGLIVWLLPPIGLPEAVALGALVGTLANLLDALSRYTGWGRRKP